MLKETDFITDYTPTDDALPQGESACYCPCCLGTDPTRSKFDEHFHAHGSTFTCRVCGAELQFGERATGYAIDDALTAHQCQSDDGVSTARQLARDALAVVAAQRERRDAEEVRRLIDERLQGMTAGELREALGRIG